MASIGRAIHIKGFDELMGHLEGLSKNIRWKMPDAARSANIYLEGQIPPYPPERPAQKYVRTGALGRSYGTEVEAIGNLTIETLTVGVPYAHWVVDENKQAWMHRGRWWTAQQVLADARDGIVAIYTKFIDGWVAKKR